MKLFAAGNHTEDMMTDDDRDLLLSRGLDGDLDRAEMRRLYHLAADDPAMAPAMGRMATVEDGLAALAAATARARPPSRPRDAMVPPVADRRWWEGAREAWRGRLGRRAGPFLGGAAVAALVVLAVVGILDRGAPVAPPRFAVVDVEVDRAHSHIDWTYQFVVRPGDAARVALDLGDSLPVQFQFESAQPVPLSVVHESPDGRRGPAHHLLVQGVRFASLRDPRPGDGVVVRNEGPAPVVIYAYTNGYGGSHVTTVDL